MPQVNPGPSVQTTSNISNCEVVRLTDAQWLSPTPAILANTAMTYQKGDGSLWVSSGSILVSLGMNAVAAAASINGSVYNVAPAGDSITANITRGLPALFDDGYLTWGQSLTEASFRIVANYGVAGDTTTLLLARMQSILVDAVSRGVNVIPIMIGTNDYPSSIPVGTPADAPTTSATLVPTMIGNIKAIAALVIAAGIAPDFIIPCPRSVNLPSGLLTLQKQLTYIEWLRVWTAATPGVRNGGDFFNVLVDKSSTICAWLANTSHEAGVVPEIHPNNYGAMLCGIEWSNAWKRNRPNWAASAFLSTSASQIYGVDPAEMLTDPWMTVGTVSAAGTNITGSFPTGWSNLATPTFGVVVASVTTDATTAKTVSSAITPSASNLASPWLIAYSVTTSRLNALNSLLGYTLEFGWRIRIPEGATNLQAVTAILQAGSFTFPGGAAAASVFATTPEAMALVIPAGGLNLVARSLPMQITYAGPNGGVFDSYLRMRSDHTWTDIASEFTTVQTQFTVRATPN